MEHRHECFDAFHKLLVCELHSHSPFACQDAIELTLRISIGIF